MCAAFAWRAGLRAGLLFGRDGARPSSATKITIHEVVEVAALTPPAVSHRILLDGFKPSSSDWSSGQGGFSALDPRRFRRTGPGRLGDLRQWRSWERTTWTGS